MSSSESQKHFAHAAWLSAKSLVRGQPKVNLLHGLHGRKACMQMGLNGSDIKKKKTRKNIDNKIIIIIIK